MIDNMLAINACVEHAYGLDECNYFQEKCLFSYKTRENE